MEDKDLIVIGSDGLFDNLFTRQIIEIVNKHGDSLETLAKTIVQEAAKIAYDPKAESPFS